MGRLFNYSIIQLFEFSAVHDWSPHPQYLNSNFKCDVYASSISKATSSMCLFIWSHVIEDAIPSDTADTIDIKNEENI